MAPQGGNKSGQVEKHSAAISYVTTLTTQKQIPDTLHNYADRPMCPNKTCLGALMQNGGTVIPKRSVSEILSDAVEFITEYYKHQKTDSDDELNARLDEITRELNETGTYTSTLKELEFGARTAWRNASRCIGRIQWQNLNFFDARHVRSTKEMFEAVCKHIEYGTNEGNIRSCITVFPPRVPGREDFRLWNPQLITYAGYLQPDGSVIGDPGRVALTKICEKLGWKGKGGRFDVLPLIFSAPNERATWYEIPKNLVMEVELEHPKFDWFAEMGLRWYVLPAVADMQFDCGGIVYPACPFNGWYMGTEIGVRNLCDKQRLNLLHEFGEKMGLAIEDPISLWKDEVLVEVNKAVLYSFAKNRVTLVDHHTASQQFMQHLSNETKKRGGCPGDWVWIVPPMSGAVTDVYHQEMLNYHLKPAFEYQIPAWRHYAWDKVKIKTKLRSVAYTVLGSGMVMTGIRDKRVKVTILFATETGRSEIFAEKLRERFARSFSVQVICMDNYDLSRLPQERLLFIVASTFGNGDAPDNGKSFWKSLCNIQKQPNAFELTDLIFSVFGLGSSLYPKFGAFGTNLDQKLRQMQGRALKPVTLADEMKGQDKLFSVWCDAVYSKSLKVFGLDEADDPDDTDDEILVDDTESFAKEGFDGSVYRLKKVVESRKSISDEKLLSELSQIHSDRRYPQLFSMKVTSREYLQKPENIFQKQSVLVRLKPSDPDQLSYQPGDHLGVFPTNAPDIVDALLKHLTQKQSAFSDLRDAILKVERLDDDDKWIVQNRLPPTTLKEAMTSFLDITSTPGQQFLASLSVMATNETEKNRLKQLAEEPEQYHEWKMSHFPSLLDVLLEFSSVNITPEFLLSCQPLLAPRLYSISSSLNAHPDEVHLTVALVQYSTHKNPKGPKKFGVCSSFLDRLPQHSVPCFVRPAPSFRLPEDNSLPIILIGAGSGIAPFRSFWQEREAIANKSGPGALSKCMLFFGCRSKSVDYLYENELSTLLRRGIVHNVFLALSREDKKIYVQDEVYAQRSLILVLLARKGAHVYVCGDAGMAEGVRKALEKVYVSEASYSETEAQNAIDDLFNQNRYHEDVFGAFHSF